MKIDPGGVFSCVVYGGRLVLQETSRSHAQKGQYTRAK